MSNKITVENREINFDVLNALNLQHPMLGDAYVSFNWNPLGEDFRLDINFLERYLENTRYKSDSKMPAFLEQDPKKVLEGFKTAAKNNQQLLDELQRRFDAGEFSSYKNTDITKQVTEILFFLKCRGKMIDIALGQLKVGGIDAFKAYENIRGINRRLSELLEEAYTEEFNKKVALANMLNRAHEMSARPDWFKSMPFDALAAFANRQQHHHDHGKNFDPMDFLAEQLNSLQQAFGSALGFNLNQFAQDVSQSTQIFSQNNSSFTQNSPTQNVPSNNNYLKGFGQEPQTFENMKSQMNRQPLHEHTPPPPPPPPAPTPKGPTMNLG